MDYNKNQGDIDIAVFKESLNNLIKTVDGIEKNMVTKTEFNSFKRPLSIIGTAITVAIVGAFMVLVLK